MTQNDMTQRILKAYLIIYAAAIGVGTVVTHNGTLAAVHVALLAIGAMVLRMILPDLIGEQA